MIRSVVLANLLLCGALVAQSASPVVTKSSVAPPSQTAKPTSAVSHSRYRPARFAGRAGTYYRLVWGVDSLAVKWSESGEIIKFTYQVVEADKAKTLNDKKLEPFLVDPRAGVKLVVPSLEKVGQLRQSSTPEAGKSYWMAFSNKGRVVKRGDRVDVVIGPFRAEGLVVD
jgi:hypothetical protein